MFTVLLDSIWRKSLFHGPMAFNSRLNSTVLVVALKHNPKIKAFYQRLVQNGKPKMVALIAAMRKLLTILNVMIQNQQSWNFQPNNP